MHNSANSTTRHTKPTSAWSPFRLVLAALALLLSAGSTVALDPDKPISQYVYDEWGTERGMPQVTALAMLQDQEGFLWFGTQSGLARFDGQRFLVFRRRDHDGLANDFIQALAMDNDGAIWIGTNVGLSRWQDGGFSAVADGQPGNVHALLNHPDHGLLAGGESGLHRVVPGASPTVEVLDSTPTYSLAIGARGELVSGHANTVRHWDGELQSRETLLDGDPGTRVMALAMHDNQLWLGTTDGLRVLDPTADSLDRPAGQPESLRALLVEALFEDRDGQLWIGSEVGLYRFYQGRFELDQTHMPNAQVRSFLQDHEHNLWVGTTSRGATRFWNGRLLRYGTAQGLEDAMVWGVSESPDGEIWAFGRVGVYVFADGRFQRRYEDSLLHPTAMNGFWDSQGRQWISNGTDMAVYRDGQRIELPQLADLPSERFYSVREFSPGEIMIGSSRYLYKAHPGGLDHIGPEQGLTERIVRDTHVDSKGTLWVATDNGLFRGSEQQLERVEDPALGSGMIATMAAHHDALWMGLQGYGVARWQDGEFRNYSTNDGLHADVVFYILRDPQDRLWFSGPGGLSVIPLEQFEQYDRGEIERLRPTVIGANWDQQRAQVNGGHASAGLAASDGYFYFPSLTGLLKVDPTASQRNEVPPPVRITHLSSRDVEWNHLGDRQSALELPAGSSNLEIQYAGLSFQNNDRVQYRYRLVGVDENWVNVGNRALAIYTNLGPGHYRFEVEAANNDGIWNTEPAVLQWRIQPFFYQTGWFLGLMILAFGLLVAGLFHWRLRSIEQQRQLLRQMVDQRTRELAEANRQLEQASLTDALTDLRNRRFLTSHIEQDVAMVRRAYTAPAKFPNRDLLFVMVDLDHFKQINDQHGHAVGDQILKQMAERLMDAIRESDYAIRWGGEEFLVVARNSERNQAHIVAERIRSAIANKPFETNDGPLTCTASVGYANYPFNPHDPEALDWEAVIDIADMALYRAKQGGRNRWIGLECAEGAATREAFEAARSDLDQALTEEHLHERQSNPGDN